MQMTHSDVFALKGLGPLDRSGWIETVAPAFRDWLACNGRWRRYDEGAIIHVAGDAPGGLFGLGRGAFETALPLGGEEPVTVFRSGPGVWFGETCVLDAGARQTTVSAARDSEVYHVPGAVLRRHLRREPDHWAALLGLSQINAAFAVALLGEALALRPRARVARMVLRLADDGGLVHARQDDLARLIGMTRSSLQRAMRSLTENGALQVGYGRMTIADRAALTRIADAP
jgi:CRP-like cAMP-binding protein